MYLVLHHQEGSFVSEKNMQNVMITIIDFKQKTRSPPFQETNIWLSNSLHVK